MRVIRPERNAVERGRTSPKQLVESVYILEKQVATRVGDSAGRSIAKEDGLARQDYFMIYLLKEKSQLKTQLTCFFEVPSRFELL